MCTSSDDVAARQLSFMRDEACFEIGLLHERVNALLAAEAFLTIAYTAAMSNGTPWGRTFSLIVLPVLSSLGLLLALLAWPGINATVRIVLMWTARHREYLEGNPSLAAAFPDRPPRSRGGNTADSDQRRSTLFFRSVPVLFGLVWAALTVVSLAIRR